MNTNFTLVRAKNYDGYAVSRDGRVWSHRTRRYLMQHLTRKGYPFVRLQLNGRSISRTVHRMVAETFIPNPLNLPQVNHIDGIKTSNNASNLEWCTNSHNQKHAYSLGLNKQSPFDYKKNRRASKLTPEQVREIRGMKGTYAATSQRFGVNPQSISNIVNRRTWTRI